MTSALRVYSHVACFLFLFSTGRLAMPQVRHESEGTPRFLSAKWGVYWGCGQEVIAEMQYSEKNGVR